MAYVKTMKYFLDTEFIEGFHKPIFGKRRHFVDLISIGIVAEDGREYYAISKEFDPKDADEWVRDNVISKLPERTVTFYDSPRMRSDSLLYKSNRQIKQDLYDFFGFKPEWTDFGSDIFSKDADIQIYAYYADYDWVVFCSLFGRMIDLPKGMPMYCMDLKQMFDEKALKMTSKEATAINCPSCTHDMYSYLESTTNGHYKIDVLKKHQNYPKQINEHSALDDARWNHELYKFLSK